MKKPDAVPLSLPPLAGGIWMPAWAVRPGAFETVEEVASCMALWGAMHSLNSDYLRPSFAGRDTLARTIGASVRTVTRQLALLKEKGLLLEVAQPIESRTKRHRPPARWALDPLRADHWRPKIEKRLAELAEEIGAEARWYSRALSSLDAFERRARILANRIRVEMPVRAPRKKKRKKPRAKLAPRAKMAHKGMGGREGTGVSLLKPSVVGPGADRMHETTVDRVQPLASNADTGPHAPKWPAGRDGGGA